MRVRKLGEDGEESDEGAHALPSAARRKGFLLSRVADRTAFIVQFPEFTNTATALVDAMLAAAALEIDLEVWGAKSDQGQMYLAAHKLALSPFGNNAEMFSKNGTTTYQAHYEMLVRQVASGFRVA